MESSNSLASLKKLWEWLEKVINKFPCINAQSDEDSQENDEIFQIKFSGLHNLGNTCYLNSILQILAKTSSFKKELSQHSDYFSRQLRKILKLLSIGTDHHVLFNSLIDFKRALDYVLPMFSGNSQNDAKLLFGMINSQVESSVFSLTIKKTYKDKNDHKFSNEEVSNFTIISEENSKSVQKYFDNIEEREYEFKDTNLLYCSQCSFECEMIMKTKIIVYPKILVLYYVSCKMKIQKKMCQMKFP